MTRIHNHKGFTLIEVLIGIAILSVVGLNIAMGTILSYKSYTHTMRNSLATQLAQTRMEELLAKNPNTLDETGDQVEPDLIAENISFTRETKIVVNPNSSRTLTVIVTSNNPLLPGSAHYVTTVTLRGSN